MITHQPQAQRTAARVPTTQVGALLQRTALSFSVRAFVYVFTSIVPTKSISQGTSLFCSSIFSLFVFLVSNVCSAFGFWYYSISIIFGINWSIFIPRRESVPIPDRHTSLSVAVESPVRQTFTPIATVCIDTNLPGSTVCLSVCAFIYIFTLSAVSIPSVPGIANVSRSKRSRSHTSRVWVAPKVIFSTR